MGKDKLDLQDKLIAFKSLIKIIGTPITTVATGDPFVAAGVTNLFLETFFGIQSELKMKRVYSFLEKLEKGIKEIDKDLDLDKVDKIEFGDLLETAIIKSSRQGQEEKIDRFKQILIGQMLHPEPFDYLVRYFEIAEKLADSQLIILKKYVSTEKDLIEIQESLSGVIKEKEDTEKASIEHKMFHQGKESENWGATLKVREAMKKGIEKLKSKEFDFQNDYNAIRRERNEQFQILGEGEFNFMLNDLRTMGLIYNPAEGRASETGEYSGYRCTPLAIGFIKFLEE